MDKAWLNNENSLINERAAWIAAAVEVVVQRVCVALLAGFVAFYLLVSFFYIEPIEAVCYAFGFAFCALMIIGTWTGFNAKEYAKTWSVTVDRF